MPSKTKLLNRALTFLNRGQKEDARKLLLAVLDQDPQNGRALLLYLDTFETRAERARGLKLLFKLNNPSSGTPN